MNPNILVNLSVIDPSGNMTQNMFPAAMDAVTKNVYKLGFPTLLCGNFITSIGPVSATECPIKQGRVAYSEYQEAIACCKKNFIESSWSSYSTPLVGKMMGAWYLPFIYLDGYIDMYGREFLTTAVHKLKQGKVDVELCKHLRWFTGQCCNTGGENKCTDDEVSSDDIPNMIKNYTSLMMFSFSERLSEVLKDVDFDRQAYALTSVSMGDENYLLQFTDALVVSRSQWEMSTEQSEAIRMFAEFFTDTKFRYKLAYGFDLDKPQVRYLLMPNRDFYEKTPAAYDPIYKDAFPFLQEAVAAPGLSQQELSAMATLLKNQCINPPVNQMLNWPWIVLRNTWP